jgi:hypothetical protein
VSKKKKHFSQNTLERHARSLEAAARRQREIGDNWAKNNSDDHPKDDRDMKRMFHMDARDLERVAQHVRNGKLKHALNKLFCMDTAARDECPDSVWNFLDRVDFGSRYDI